MAAPLWEVSLPERGARSSSWSRPRAVLSVTSESHGSEELRIPVAVGRRLVARGDELSPGSRAELLHLLAEEERSCGRLRVEELVGRRDFSAAELERRLREEGYPTGVSAELVGRARECGLVDDARFGAAFARSKVAAGWGRARIERELERRGVSPEAVEGWPEEFVSADEERERALALASRRRLTGSNDYVRIVRFLCGRGFSPSLSCDVAREVMDAAR